MGSHTEKKQILELHLELESVMAELYKQFSTVFKEHHNFWQSLADEEKQHVTWLNKLIEGINANKVIFDEGKTRVATLNSALNYLKSTKKEFETKPFSIIKAVSFIRDFENSLLQKNVFINFDGDSIQVKEVIAKLAAAQQAHVKHIETGVRKILDENVS